MKKVSYNSHVRAPDGRVAGIDALASGVARVVFPDKTTKLVAKNALRGARWNSADHVERSPRAPRDPKAPVAHRSTVLAGVCEALGLDPRKARQRLRKAGLHAPYDNEDQLMKVLR